MFLFTISCDWYVCESTVMVEIVVLEIVTDLRVLRPPEYTKSGFWNDICPYVFLYICVYQYICRGTPKKSIHTVPSPFYLTFLTFHYDGSSIRVTSAVF
jgi:hypothetical protein